MFTSKKVYVYVHRCAVERAQTLVSEKQLQLLTDYQLSHLHDFGLLGMHRDNIM